MNGQTVLSKNEKREMIREFSERVNPYDPPKPTYKMDLRGYAKYLDENNIQGPDVTEEVMAKFIVQ